MRTFKNGTEVTYKNVFGSICVGKIVKQFKPKGDQRELYFVSNPSQNGVAYRENDLIKEVSELTLLN